MVGIVLGRADFDKTATEDALGGTESAGIPVKRPLGGAVGEVEGDSVRRLTGHRLIGCSVVGF